MRAAPRARTSMCFACAYARAKKTRGEARPILPRDAKNRCDERAENTKIKSSYVRWARPLQKKVNESARASCALTRFSCTLRD
jgi:hypothetical protein